MEYTMYVCITLLKLKPTKSNAPIKVKECEQFSPIISNEDIRHYWARTHVDKTEVVIDNLIIIETTMAVYQMCCHLLASTTFHKPQQIRLVRINYWIVRVKPTSTLARTLLVDNRGCSLKTFNESRNIEASFAMHEVEVVFW